MKARLVVAALIILGIAFGYMIRDVQADSQIEALSSLVKEQEIPSGIEVYKKGIQKLWKEGPTQAETYFDTEMRKSGDLMAMFGKGSALFLKKDFPEAERRFEYIIQSSRPGSLITMNSYYMLGLINVGMGETDAATRYLNTALQYFERIEYTENIWKCHLSLAKNYLNIGKFAAAEKHLTIAFNEDLTSSEALIDSSSLGFFYNLKSIVRFFQGDVPKALEYAKLSLEGYKKNEYQDGICSSTILVGLYETLNGNIEGGRQYTIDAQKIFPIDEFQSKDLYYYNFVNFVLIYKCEDDMTYMEAMAKILEYLKTNHDPWLQALLDYAIKWDCKIQ